MGYIVDDTCILWSHTDCSDFGHCLQYDLADYRLKLVTFLLVAKVVSIAMYMICWVSLKIEFET